MKNKLFFILFALVAMTVCSASLVSCSDDDDSSGSGGGSSSYAFQGKTYSGYTDGDWTVVTFSSAGNSILGTSDGEGMSGTYTVSGSVVVITWRSGYQNSLVYDSKEDSFSWGSDILRRQ